ncbi:DUF4192 domain-containing protein [Sphaerisporangium sp. NPDC005289]|uniref:DUF4192 domain-containing protein n=1 Tax=Sphaerisporangium sp. NPDC005289 TaxID=3155247 RepID=UPI0033A3D757
MNLSHRLVITSPSNAVAVTPYLLGFHPTDSLVVIGLGPGSSFTLRFDLVRREHYKALLAHMRGLMVRNDAEAAVLLGYGSEDMTVPLLTQAWDTLADTLAVKDVVRVDGGRWWSLMCTDPQCCPREGRPYDINASQLAAQATFAGLVAYRSREEMAAMVAPVEGEDRVWMAAETERAQQEFLSDGPASRLLLDEGLQLVRSLIGEDRRLTDEETARLSIVLIHLRVRDEAWARLLTLDSQQQLRLWQDTTRRAIGEYAAAPAALLAFLAYINGDGTLAKIALERCAEVAPSYRMAALIEDCLRYGLPPQTVRERFDGMLEMLPDA